MSFFDWLFGKRKPKLKFPDWAHAQCANARADMLALVKAKRVHKVSARSLRVEFMPAQRRINGQWAVQLDGNWVLGQWNPNSNLITVAIDPKRATDPAAIEYGTLQHEMLHYWLQSAGDHIWHDPVYDGVFKWAESRAIVGKSRGESGGGGKSLNIGGVHYDLA
jgi:hypothetical protein